MKTSIGHLYLGTAVGFLSSGILSLAGNIVDRSEFVTLYLFGGAVYFFLRAIYFYPREN